MKMSSDCYIAFVVQCSGWTKYMDAFLSWISAISYIGGGISEAAICEGVSDQLLVHSHVLPRRHCRAALFNTLYASPCVIFWFIPLCYLM
jgi:hypothetical protein